MKVLHVISSLEIGGAQRLLSDLLPIQKNNGVDVSLLVYKQIDNEFSNKVKSAGIPIISIEQHNFYNPSIIFKLRKEFKKFDLVHVHLFPSLYWSSIAARWLKKALIYTEHSTYNSRRGKWYLRPLEKFIYYRYTKIVSISRQTQDSISDWLKLKDNRFEVINNGVDTRRFSEIMKPVKPNSLIMVSRFTSSKDHETVIRAMTLIDKSVFILFVGDGETKARCENLAISLNVSDRVIFLGSRSDVADLIAESYIGIQSSNWEGFGLTAVEIMACGKPIVATSVDGLKQVVDGAGLLFEIGDFNGLATIVNDIIHDEKKYATLSQKSISRALEYDIHVMAQKYLKLYSDLNNAISGNSSISD